MSGRLARFAMLSTALLLLAPLVSGPHPDSLSSSHVRVEGARATAALRLQTLSLIEVMPAIDPDRDGILDTTELEAARADIGRYLTGHYHLTVVEGEREQPLDGTLVSLTAEDPAALNPFDLQSVDAELAFEAPRPLEVLEVECTLFREANPWHKDSCFLAWNGEEDVPHLFSGSDTRWRFEPSHVRRPGVLALFLELGMRHILGGYDHQAFLLALLVASRRARSIVGTVTAFTVAHSLTLASAALGWVHVPSRFVELAIALSIAYVACDNLLRGAPRNPWFEAFTFGLLHGLGFAGFLSQALAGEPLVLTALFAFNVGVELGQLFLVVLCLGILALAFRAHRRRARGDPALGLVPSVVRSFVSILVALCGFYWFVERAGWLPWA